MYAKTSDRISSESVRVDIISADTPAEFPLSTENISNLPDGMKLVPYSSLYIASTSDLYILGSDWKWYLHGKSGTGGGSGEGNGDRAATDEEIADLIGGLDL